MYLFHHVVRLKHMLEGCCGTHAYEVSDIQLHYFSFMHNFWTHFYGIVNVLHESLSVFMSDTWKFLWIIVEESRCVVMVQNESW